MGIFDYKSGKNQGTLLYAEDIAVNICCVLKTVTVQHQPKLIAKEVLSIQFHKPLLKNWTHQNFFLYFLCQTLEILLSVSHRSLGLSTWDVPWFTVQAIIILFTNAQLNANFLDFLFYLLSPQFLGAWRVPLRGL